MAVELFISPSHAFRAGVVANDADVTDVKVCNVMAIVVVVIFVERAIELRC